METKRYCDNLEALLLEDFVRAIHQAWLELSRRDENVDCEHYDNGPAIARDILP